MGKGTDKLYITHSEWASEDAFSASSGAAAGASTRPSRSDRAAFSRLPFNYCALSLQPFQEPVCTPAGTVFDLASILTWLSKEQQRIDEQAEKSDQKTTTATTTNPVDGTPLHRADLITLRFAKNEDGDYIDPVTYKAFTNNTHLVAIATSGNVFAYDTLHRLNIKPKVWTDLVSDQPFTKRDLITLQDPHNLGSRNLAEFAHVKENNGRPAVPDGPDSSGINTAALGSSAKLVKAHEAAERAKKRREDAAGSQPARTDPSSASSKQLQPSGQAGAQATAGPAKPRNLAHYTTGQAAASFTSTGLTPQTESTLATLSEEEFLLQPKVVKQTGFARIDTSVGSVTLELFPEFAPRAVWNMIKLAEQGFYRNIKFHRNIRNFMIQGGDPTGTGRGGSSVWKRPFRDELEGPLTHSSRGVLSMANKGKDTNTSQFFLTYRPCPHLDRKHTIFGKLVSEEDADSLATLARLEAMAPTSSAAAPTEAPTISDIVILVDPFKEYLAQTGGLSGLDKKKLAKDAKPPVKDEDLNYTWTGKRVRGTGPRSETSASVGKYLQTTTTTTPTSSQETAHAYSESSHRLELERPVKKKKAASGFGNFDGW